MNLLFCRFPLFSFFESSVDGIVPNEFDSPSKLLTKIFEWCICKWRLVLRFSAMHSTRAPISDRSGRTVPVPQLSTTNDSTQSLDSNKFSEKRDDVLAPLLHKRNVSIQQETTDS